MANQETEDDYGNVMVSYNEEFHEVAIKFVKSKKIAMVIAQDNLTSVFGIQNFYPGNFVDEINPSGLRHIADIIERLNTEGWYK